MNRDVEEERGEDGGGEEGEDDEELNAATFGDTADEEGDFLWDNVAIA